MANKYKISVIAGGGNWSKETDDIEFALAEGKRLAKLGENTSVIVYEVIDGVIGRIIGNFYVGNF